MGVNTNFIAAAGWGVQNTTGQAITLQIDSTGTVSGGVTTYTGYADIIFNREVLRANAYKNGLIGVTPNLDFTPKVGAGSTAVPVSGVHFFEQFIQRNTVHITKMNFRAGTATTLPTSVVILTPNLFTGQMDRQVVNVTADTTMYQQQSNIVTMSGLDLYISRDSVIRFEGAFSEATKPSLNIDVTIDKYISVEKSLLENMQQLNTAAGAAENLENVAANAANVLNPNAIRISDVSSPTLTAAINQRFADNINLANVPVKTNSRGNR